MEFGKVLGELSRFLEQGGFRYSVAGAFALHAYGISQATTDLDFAVEAAARPALLRHLESLGYEQLHASAGFSNHLHSLAGLGRIDFIYVEPATADLLFGNATKLEIVPGFFAPVPRPEHLAAMKVLAMKNDPARTYQDMADIHSILALPGVDREEIRGYFVRYGLEERYGELELLARS